jgi:hypothetical protein
MKSHGISTAQIDQETFSQGGNFIVDDTGLSKHFHSVERLTLIN